MTMYGPGFSLRSLLENPDLQNPPNLNRGGPDLKKGSKLGGYAPNTNSAFLGSNLWDRPSNYEGCNDSKDFDLEYMDLDEFLSENGIPVNPDDADDSQTISLLASALARSPTRSPNPLSPGLMIDPVSPPRNVIVGAPEIDKMASYSNVSSPLASPTSPMGQISRSPQVPSAADTQQTGQIKKPVPSAIERYLLDDDFGIKLPLTEPEQTEPPKAIRKRKLTETESDVSMVTIPVYHPTSPHSTIHSVSSPQLWEPSGPQYDSDDSCCSQDSNMVNNMIPGQDGFDPTARKFSVDELKPQPIIKKAKKVFVDDVAKDDKYWQRRKKNNVAAKRSREARRVKENQIAMRAAFLEQENDKLRKSYDRIQRENDELVKRLSKYEKVE